LGTEAALRIGVTHEFRDPALLALALTHRSAAGAHNERLEFLGDAIIGFVIAEFLYSKFPRADEGQLTRTRATLVNRDTLADIARELDLGNAIRLGEGEMKSGGWRRDSILANALEAVVGAIYLDAGTETTRQILLQWYRDRLLRVDPTATRKDAKTRLQEHLQRHHQPLPIYETVNVQGPAHDQHFVVRCQIADPDLAVEATGNSRRQAEQEAARLALAALLPEQEQQ